MFETEYVDPTKSLCPECGSSFGVHLITCSRFVDPQQGSQEKGSALFDLFPAPWHLRNLQGKYYGTVVEDAEGDEIVTLWSPKDHDSQPSSRQLSYLDCCLEEWNERNLRSEYSSHWESQKDFLAACHLLRIINEHCPPDSQP